MSQRWEKLSDKFISTIRELKSIFKFFVQRNDISTEKRIFIQSLVERSRKKIKIQMCFETKEPFYFCLFLTEDEENKDDGKHTDEGIKDMET